MIDGTAFGLIVKARVSAALAPAALLAAMAVLNAPLAVGVPLMAPVLVFKLRPAGSTLGATTAKEVKGPLVAVI